MKKHITVFVFCLFIFSSCQNSNSSASQESNQDSVSTAILTEETEVTQLADYSNQTTYTSIFRSDGFKTGIKSEWIQSRRNSDMTEILEILYWNTENKEKISLEIVSQKCSQSEETSGCTGEVRFPNTSEIVSFGTIEENFNLIFEGNKRQEFNYEQK